MKDKEIIAYEQACNDLAKKFVKKYFDKDADWRWIAGDVGGILEVEDYYFNLKIIIST